jgi:hypothetical protein
VDEEEGEEESKERGCYVNDGDVGSVCEGKIKEKKKTTLVV